MSNSTPTTSRRDVLAGAGFFAGIAVAPSALAISPTDGRWADLAEQVHNWSPDNGRRVVQIARAAGMRPEDFSALVLGGSERFKRPNLFPQIVFTRDGVQWIASPTGCARVEQ